MSTPLLEAMLADGPQGLWPMDDPPGSSTFRDLSGNAHTGTPASIAFGGGSLLPGGDQSALCVNPSSALKLSSGAVPIALPQSFEVWRQGTSPGSSTGLGLFLACSGSSPVLSEFQMNLSGSTWQLQWLSNGSTIKHPLTGDPFDGNWHQYGVAIDAEGNLTFIMDGASVGTAAGITVATGSSPWIIYPNSENSWNGSCGPAAAYPSALTVEQFANHWNAQTLLDVSDAGMGADGMSLGPRSLSDDGIGSETPSHLTIITSDHGYGVDEDPVGASIAQDDAGSGVEGVSLGPAGIGDVGTASEDQDTAQATRAACTLVIEPCSGHGPVIQGDLVQLTATWTDPDSGDPVEPSNVMLAYVMSAGPPTRWAYGVPGSPVVRLSTGIYRLLVDTTPLGPGVLIGEAASEGVGQAVASSSIAVRPAPIVPGF